jgi:predicted MFS family arabinose efflux permease
MTPTNPITNQANMTASPPQNIATGLLTRQAAIVVFLAFAFAYFLSALVRAVVATLAPTLTQELSLQASDLGLLAGGYFLGFAFMQLPLGAWLDKYGPRRVIVGLLVAAVLGCVAFALAQGFTSLLLARVLIGVGVSACLMAPLTGYRRWLAPQTQVRANSWMLMTGSLGMVASTLPVQWWLDASSAWGWLAGWRGLFMVLALLIAVAMFLLWRMVPHWQSPGPASAASTSLRQAYAPIWANPYFRRHAPLGFFSYGGLVAVQTLWAGPWLVKVSGYSAAQAAQGLFIINLCMLVAFWAWGMIAPRLARTGWHADRLIALGLPLNFLVLAIILIAGNQVNAWAWALFCVTNTFISLAQPAMSMAFAPQLAGRALSAYNLLIFAGVFAVQWGIGLLIDVFGRAGLGTAAAYQAAFGVFGACCVASYVFYMLYRDNQAQAPTE